MEGPCHELAFPLICDLPSVVSVQGWLWKQYADPNSAVTDFWVGTDHQGNQWLTKVRGSFYAYREIVFARIAQRLGWSCQSSIFGVFPDDVPPILRLTTDEKIHALHWLLPEHQISQCCADCPIDPNANLAATLQNLPLSNTVDWLRGEIAAYLFGGNEPPGILFTQDHALVIIDSEQMFSSMPSILCQIPWWTDRHDAISTIARQVAVDLSVAVAKLSDTDLQEFLEAPRDIHISERRRVERILKKARDEARTFSASHHGA